MKLFCLCLFLIASLWSGEAQAGISDRLLQFPQWEKPSIASAKGDLVYPSWMEGTWEVTSTLIDLVAPLAPEIVTPGFENNRRYLDRPIKFQVRFERKRDRFYSSTPSFLELINPTKIVADRVFNGLNIAKAYLGDRAILSVKIDPNSPNRQITSFRGEKQLFSIITGRETETPAINQFVATEVSNQIFRGIPQPYFNTVETTTSYQLLPTTTPNITADQVTAIYLSPQDADYFKAGDRPVALYRYQLELTPIELESSE